MTNENPNEVLVPIETSEDVQVGDELVCQQAHPSTFLRVGERLTVKRTRTGRDGGVGMTPGDHVLITDGTNINVVLGPSYASQGYHIPDWRKVVKPPAGETWTKIDSYADLKVGDELVCVVPKPTSCGFKFLDRYTVVGTRTGYPLLSNGYDLRSNYEFNIEWRKEGHRLVKKTQKPVPMIEFNPSKETTMVRDALGAIPRGTNVWRKSDGKPGVIYSVQGSYYASGLVEAGLCDTRYEISGAGGSLGVFTPQMTEADLLRDYSFTKPEAPKDCIVTFDVSLPGNIGHQIRETPTTAEEARRRAPCCGEGWKAYRLVPLDG